MEDIDMDQKTAPARLEKAIERATTGKDLVGFYEPRPGQVRAYRHIAAGDFDETTIDLRGATLVAWVGA